MVYDVVLPAVFSVLFAGLGFAMLGAAGSCAMDDDSAVRWGGAIGFACIGIACFAFVAFFVGGWIFDYQAVTQ